MCVIYTTTTTTATLKPPFLPPAPDPDAHARPGQRRALTARESLLRNHGPVIPPSTIHLMGRRGSPTTT